MCDGTPYMQNMYTEGDGGKEGHQNTNDDYPRGGALQMTDLFLKKK